MTIFFPDISYYEPGANIAGILKQSGGVIGLRAGYGSFVDPKFASWRNQAKAAKAVLIYHFPVKPGRKYGMSVDANADEFIKIIGKRRANEVLVMDVESASGSWSLADCKRYMTRVHNALGGPTLMIYANDSYVSEHGLGSLFTTSKGWVARYGAPGHDASQPHAGHVAWQHAADGYGKPRVHWAGCPTSTDESRADMTMDEFLKRVFSGGVVPKAPAPAPKPAPAPVRVPVPPGTPVLKMGSKGPAVKALQHALNVRHAGLHEDGDFGPATDGAVRAFQRQMKLTPDGQYGPQTAAALKKAVG